MTTSHTHAMPDRRRLCDVRLGRELAGRGEWRKECRSPSTRWRSPLHRAERQAAPRVAVRHAGKRLLRAKAVCELAWTERQGGRMGDRIWHVRRPREGERSPFSATVRRTTPPLGRARASKPRKSAKRPPPSFFSHSGFTFSFSTPLSSALPAVWPLPRCPRSVRARA